MLMRASVEVHILLGSIGSMLCMCPGDLALRELPSPGKSGSMFFLSHDDKYIIKTMRKVIRPLRSPFQQVLNSEQPMRDTASYG